VLIDLHTHSYPKSDDSFAAVDDLIDKAKSACLDGICLTDHDFFWSNDEVRDLARRHDFLVLPGCEINTDTGHVLVFGLDRYVFGMHKPDFLVNAVRQREGAMIAAHPYRRRFLEDPGHLPEARQEMLDRASGDEFFGSCDGIEGINGRGKDVQNLFSQDLAERLGIKMTGGSDAHRVEQIGTAATAFERKITGLDDLIQEIKAGRFRAETLINSQEASRSA
jgi:predicted metal-dependent phosphoesterase TrpH